MTVVLETRRDITLEAFRRVAWQGEGVCLHERALDAIERSRRAFLALLEADPDLVVYGVTSGYGQMAHLRYTPEERRQHARRPPIAPMTSFGEALPERVARGMVLARLTNIVEGHAAISLPLARAVAGLLDGAPLPPVPALGNGCPGEIQALAHLFSGLFDERARDGSDGDLGEKESIALVNGSPCAAALAADAALAARRRVELAVAVFALSVEALKAPLDHYDAVLEALWEDPGEVAVLRLLRAWLEGAGGAGEERRAYQAPVSWRILPRVLGQAWRAADQAEEVAAVGLRAVSDNPLFVLPDGANPLGRVLTNGGYHNGRAYPALDNLAAAWADLALLCDRHVTKLLDARTSHLPAFLSPSGAGHMGAGEGYIGCLGFSAAGYAEQARLAATRHFLPGSEGGGFGQNDVALPTFLAWRSEAEAGRCLEANLAQLAVIASQAFHVTERGAPPRLAPLLDEVRAHCPPLTAPRPLAGDVERLAGHFNKTVFGDAPLLP
ncbi:MAG: aromatic amino acid lyase [Kiloniellales bacterium]|nr:aromatic amino acid lyase [Kiloniellales bacterium]